jgi:predicted amidohydrolase
MTRIVCRQLAPTIGDLESNVRMSTAAVSQSVAAGAQLVIMPELVTAGYLFESPEEARSVAVTPDHPVFEAWAKAVGDVGGVVVGGFAELGDDGFVYNSAAVVDGSGVLAVYRKDHLWDKEKLWFKPGSAVPPIVETPFGRLGILVCYDMTFPEMTRSVALRGADLIVGPTNWPLFPHPEGEHPAVVAIVMAAALSNRVAIACCDRSGTERGQEWTQGSCIINHNGEIVATANQDGIVTADLDLTLSRDKRISELNDSFGDRRPELYGAITAAR